VDNGLDRDTDIFLTTDHGEFSTSLSWRTIQSSKTAMPGKTPSRAIQSKG